LQKCQESFNNLQTFSLTSWLRSDKNGLVMQSSMRKFGVWLWIMPLLASSASWASMFDIQLWNGSTESGNWASPIIDTGSGYKVSDVTYSPSGAIVHAYNMTMGYDPFISASVDVVNNTALTQTYTLIFTLPISPPITPGSRIGGSTQGGLTDANNDGVGTLSTVGPGTALYYGQIDGADVLPLFPDPNSLSVPFRGGSASESTSAGLPGPTIPGPSALTSIGIKHEFSLTAGDRATFTSFFDVEAVPEPGSLSLLAVGGLIMAFRRRH
jgi:hypothetical protein